MKLKNIINNRNPVAKAVKEQPTTGAGRHELKKGDKASRTRQKRDWKKDAKRDLGENTKTTIAESTADVELKIADELVAFLKNKGVASGDVQKAEMFYSKATSGIRDWGNWEVPADAEDDGDYDWEVPTRATYEKLNGFVDVFAKKYPDVKINIRVGEKNWFSFEVVAKK